jgi:cystathionine gamma-lyase
MITGLKSHPQHQIALKQQEGHSGMLGFYIKGGLKEAAKFMNSVNIIRKATSLGADISLVTIP